MSVLQVVYLVISLMSAQMRLYTLFLHLFYYLWLRVVCGRGLIANYRKLLPGLVVAGFLASPHIREKYFAKPVKPAKKGGEPRA